MLTTKSHTFPLPSQQSIEVDFIENRQGGLQRAGIEQSCTFDTERRKFVSQTVVGASFYDEQLELANPLELQETRDNLQKAIDHLKDHKAKKSQKIANFCLSDAHCWTDIVRIVTEAEASYLKDDTTSRKVRKAFRKLGENAKSIKPFVGLLPDGNYKTLCGGLNLVLTVSLVFRDNIQGILTRAYLGHDEED